MLSHLDAPLLGIHLLQPVLLSKPLHGLPPELIFFLLLPRHPLSLHAIHCCLTVESLQLLAETLNCQLTLSCTLLSYIAGICQANSVHTVLAHVLLHNTLYQLMLYPGLLNCMKHSYSKLNLHAAYAHMHVAAAGVQSRLLINKIGQTGGNRQVAMLSLPSAASVSHWQPACRPGTALACAAELQPRCTTKQLVDRRVPPK